MENDFSSGSALHSAVASKDVEAVRTLLQEENASLDASDDSGRTPLHIASCNPDELEIIDLLLSRGANVNAVDSAGMTSLMYAIKLGKLNLAEKLIAHCEDINFRCEVSLRKQVGDDTNPECVPVTATTLHYAVSEGQLQIVYSLILNNADLNITTSRSESALHIAAQRGYREIAEKLIDSGADIEAVDIEGFTPLHHATKYVVALLLHKGANPNVPARNNWTPLHMVALSEDLEKCELLVQHGADPNALSTDRKTPLSIAVEKRNHRFIELLVKYCPHLNKKLDPHIVRTALKRKDYDFLSFYSRYGFSVRRRMPATKGNLSRCTGREEDRGRFKDLPKVGVAKSNAPIADKGIFQHATVKCDTLPKAERWSDDGADVNVLCRTEMMKKALRKSSVNTKDDYHKFLSFAIKNRSKHIIDFLFDNSKHDINWKDDDGLTVLHHVVITSVRSSCDSSNHRVIKYLLRQGADVNAKTKSGLAVAHMVALPAPLSWRKEAVLDILLEYNVDVNISCYGITPLHLCALSKSAPLCTKLLRKNADVNISCDGISPLHSCAFVRSAHLCRQLLENGAQVNAKLNNGKTALQVAVSPSRADFETLFKFLASSCHDDLDTLFDKMSDKFFHSVLWSDGNEAKIKEVVEVLLDFGADLNHKDNDGKTALHHAAENKSMGWALLEELIKRGANWMARDNFLRTPVHSAAINKRFGNVEQLINLTGTDVNCKDVEGFTPLHRLAQEGSAEVKELLKWGADINAVNIDNYTPLEVAQKQVQFLNSIDGDVERFQWTFIIGDLKRHAVKLQVIGYEVSFQNCMALGDFYEQSLLKKCVTEVESLKREINSVSNLSYYDFLKAPLKNLIEFADLKEDLENKDIYEKFPTYANELKVREIYLKKALKRSCLLNRCLEVYRCYGKCVIPDLVFEYMLQYFSDYDLANMVQSFSKQHLCLQNLKLISNDKDERHNDNVDDSTKSATAVDNK